MRVIIMGIDYKQLLTKYMRHVLECDGISYVRGDMESFTENEVKELRRIAAENEALDEN